LPLKHEKSKIIFISLNRFPDLPRVLRGTYLFGKESSENKVNIPEIKKISLP
jgi:hypothetical protein